MSKLTHLDDNGARAWSMSRTRPVTAREATAEAMIALSAEAFAAVIRTAAPKGDVLAAARIAGIMAAKKTPELIPLCHPIALDQGEIEFEPLRRRTPSASSPRAKTSGQTGVEMEALTAASQSRR